MGANSKIEWCDHTFNPWVGCTKVSPACDHCYAEAWAKRTGSPGLWEGERRRTSEAYWRQPLRWNREAERDGVRRRVFCASLADVFDNQVATWWRTNLWSLIEQTPHLDWLLLTKRPQNFVHMLPADWLVRPRPNVWLGVTVENQAEADRRIPRLLSIRAAVHFLSCEPLLGPIDLNTLDGTSGAFDDCADDGVAPCPTVSWVICGGESGPGARPMHPEWARGLRDQCAAAGVPFFFKQWGEWLPRRDAHVAGIVGAEVRFPWGRCQPDMERVGKARAGRLLDGREHNDVPVPALREAAA